MKKIKRVDRIEVKRAFLVADYSRRSKNKRDFLGKIDEKEYNKKLSTAKKKILALPEKKLDAMIADDWIGRLIAFNTSDWYMGTVKPSEVGVWARAGKLPREWTNDTLAETARHVRRAINAKSKKLRSRAGSTIPNILKINIDILQNEKYLLPIIFEGDTGTRGRKRFKKQMKGDIDDGCMRSIALTINGAKNIKAYIGFAKSVDYINNLNKLIQ